MIESEFFSKISQVGPFLVFFGPFLIFFSENKVAQDTPGIFPVNLIYCTSKSAEPFSRSLRSDTQTRVMVDERSGARTHNAVKLRGFLRRGFERRAGRSFVASPWERLFTHISSPHPGFDGYLTIDNDGNCQIAKA